MTSPHPVTHHVIMTPSVALLLPLVMCLLADVTEHACPVGCSCVSGTHRVDCTGAGLRQFVWNLPDPTALREIIMADNQIQGITNEIISYPDLLQLDLSANQIHVIFDGAFDYLQKLQTLNLAGNKYENVSAGAFRQKRSSLSVLNLSNNGIRYIADGAFDSLKLLSELVLSNNQLKELRKDMFRGLGALKELYINNNEISHLNPEVFGNFRQLSTLVLDMNSINNISEQIFQNLTNTLLSLSLEGNAISYLPEYIFSRTEGVPRLKTLSLKNNNLQLVPSRMLGHLENLESLDLSNNPIALLDPDSFKGLRQLRTLILSNCPELAIIRSYSLSELFNLQTVEISSNPKLETIEPLAFKASHNLKEVRLKDNALTAVDYELLEWDKLQVLVLTGNPWNCICSLSFLPAVLTFIENQNGSHMHSFELSEVRCSEPELLVGRSVIDLSRDYFGCDPSTFDPPTQNTAPEFSSSIMIAIICTFAGALLTCLAMLLWRTRHQNFHTDTRNTQAQRRRRLKKINREYSVESASSSEGPKVVSASSLRNASDQPFAAEGPQDGASDDDDVFSNDPDIVTSVTTSERERKVSFSDRVVVRTYQSIEEIDETGSVGSVSSIEEKHGPGESNA